MTTMRCRNCGGESLRQRRVNRSGNRLSISTFKDVVLTTTVCPDCGLVEQWISEPEHRQAVRDKWDPVTP